MSRWSALGTARIAGASPAVERRKTAWRALTQTPAVFWREARSVRLFPMARPFPFLFPNGQCIPTPTPSYVALYHTPIRFPFFVRRGFGTAASSCIRNVLLQILLRVRHRHSNFGFRSISEADPCAIHCLQFQIQLQGFLTLRNQDLVRLRIKRRLQDPKEQPFPLENPKPNAEVPYPA